GERLPPRPRGCRSRDWAGPPRARWPRSPTGRRRARARRARSWSRPHLPRGSRLLAALLEKLGHEPRPARLVAGPDARPVVPVEVLVEEEEVLPVGIAVEDLRNPEDGSAPVGPGQEDAGEAPREIRAHLPEIHELGRPRGTGHLEIVAEEVVVLLQRL